MCDCSVRDKKLFGKCFYCANVLCWHSHFVAYNQDSTVDCIWGMRECCNRRLCVLRFKHEKKINENTVQADIEQNPRKYLGYNAIQYANVWLERKRQLKHSNVLNPDIYWD